MKTSNGSGREIGEREFGMVVLIKDNTFGFIRSPVARKSGEVNDIFFHFDEIRNQAAIKVGSEVSFIVKIKGNRTSATRIEVVPAGSCFAQFYQLHSHELLTEFGKVVSLKGSGMPSFAGVVETANKERIPFSLVDGTQHLTVGALCSFQVCIHPLYNSPVAVGPLTCFPPQAMQGTVTPIVHRIDDRFEIVHSYASDVRVGDRVWMLVHDGSAVVLSLVRPEMEESFWENDKRETGTVVMVKEGQFAFLASRGKQQVYVPWSEVCASTLDSSVFPLKVQDVVSFELSQQTSSKKDMAKRVFNLSFNKCAAQSNRMRVVVAKSVHARIEEGKQVSYVPTQDMAENTHLFHSLLNTKEEGVDLSGLSFPVRSLATLYASTLLTGLSLANGGSTVQRSTEGEVNLVPRHVVSLEGVSHMCTVGDSVVVDLYLIKEDSHSVRRIAVLAFRKPLVHEKDEEYGLVLPNGLIASGHRWNPVIFKEENRLMLKSGNLVKFKIKNAEEATEVSLVSDEHHVLGVHFDEQRVLRGVCCTRACLIPQYHQQHHLAEWMLQQSTSNGPGGIVVGRSVRRETEQDQEQETEEMDWRKLAEFQRMVRTRCSLHLDEVDAQDPIAVFEASHKEQVQVIEKEAKSLGLQTVRREREKLHFVAVGKKPIPLKKWKEWFMQSVEFKGTEATVVGCYENMNRQVLDLEFQSECGLSVASCLESSGMVQPKTISPAKEENFSSQIQEWLLFGETEQVVFPKEAEEACVQEGLVIQRSDGGITASCALLHDFSILAEEKFVGRFGFYSTHENEMVPLEGDEVEFTPGQSLVSGRLRARNVRIVNRNTTGRVEGRVEEARGGGGWIRPAAGGAAIKFETKDVVSKSLSVGDEVDFKFGVKDKKATMVRFLRIGPPPATTVSSSPAVTAKPQERVPLKLTKATTEKKGTLRAMPVNYLTAPGPDTDNTKGFTAEKWRFKRNIKVRAEAPVFIPEGFREALE